MFTALAHKSLAGNTGYFVGRLSQNNYCAADEMNRGQWLGKGVERLGRSSFSGEFNAGSVALLNSAE
jgi:hypothetical protein